MTMPNPKNVFQKLKYILPLNVISKDDRDRGGGKRICPGDDGPKGHSRT